jgi:cytidylate kinase
MPLTIIISGPAGSGKSTLAKRLAKRYKLKLCIGSEFFKEIIKRQGLKIRKNFWDTEDGMKFLRLRYEDHSIDKEVDKLLLKIAKKGKVVITSWTLPYLGAPGIKVFLTANLEERAIRIAKRDGIEFGKALEIVERRDEENFKLYKEIYGFEFGKNLSIFDIVIDTTDKEVKEVEKEVVKYIESARKNNFL